MSSSHEIIIDNFKPDETVHYSVIIIKGHVKNGSNALCGNNEIYINLNSSTNSQTKLIEHKFKILTELNLGQNSIRLKYCCTSIKITLNYCQKPTNFSIIPLYIICQDHDGRFQAPETENNTIESACKRITLCSKLLQSVIAEKLYEENLGRKTFKVKECQVFHSKLNYLKAREMTQEQLWNNLGREIANSSLQSEEIKFLGFLSCTVYTTDDDNPPQNHHDIVKSTQAYVALGGGGLALFGSACLYTWPEDLSKVIKNFENNTPINTKKFMDDSCYRGTWGGCFSTTLGSVLHELCHTFDLGHTEKGIMGRGFDNIYKVFMINKNEKTLLNNFQSNIEFKETLNSDKKIFTVNKNRIVEEDDTFWTKSCLLLLAYHRWINDVTISANKTIKFDPVTKFITSTAGIRVLELRNETDGMVLKYWTFQGRVLKYSFQIPHDDFNQNIPVLLLVVEDNVGNILKQNI